MSAKCLRPHLRSCFNVRTVEESTRAGCWLRSLTAVSGIQTRAGSPAAHCPIRPDMLGGRSALLHARDRLGFSRPTGALSRPLVSKLQAVRTAISQFCDQETVPQIGV